MINFHKSFRLKLLMEAAGMHPPFYLSSSYGHPVSEVTKVSDKMQTKTAKKRPGIRMWENIPRESESQKIFIQWRCFHNHCKGSHFRSEIKIRTIIHQGVNQPPHPDMLLFCSRFEFVPGLPVNGDDHLHPLLVFREGLPSTPRSCSAPCIFSHIQSSFVPISI